MLFVPVCPTSLSCPVKNFTASPFGGFSLKSPASVGGEHLTYNLQSRQTCDDMGRRKSIGKIENFDDISPAGWVTQ
jgi:hypothetical protein